MSKYDSDDVRSGSPLARTLSVEVIGPKITSLFRKRKRDQLPISQSPSDESGNEDSEDLAQVHKRRRVKSKQQEEFEARELQLDAELPEELRRFRPKGYRFNLPPTDRPIRIYADGVFDLFHLGHMRQLEQAKKSFPNVELVCGIPLDKETHKQKGLTVLTDKQRCDTLTHCRWVDEVIPNAPWCVTTDFLLEHRIDYVAHDDLPYASNDLDDIYMPIKKKGMFLTTQRTEGISTSDIITKVIRDYDKYLMRNFARGATRKELNVSWLKKNELEFKKHISDFRTYWMRNKNNFNNVSKDLYFEVREFVRKRKENNSGDLDDMSSRASSPLAEFASRYIANKNEKPMRLILGNFKDWIGMDDEDLMEETPGPEGSANVTSDESEKTNEELVRVLEEVKEEAKSNDDAILETTRKIKKPRRRKAY